MPLEMGWGLQLVLVINHYGDTTMYRDDTVDNGFTVAGRVFDMSSPDKVSLVAQSLLDHFVGRMTFQCP